jgi:hypothetical protein
MSRNSLLLLPALLGAIAVPVAPALAGENNSSPTDPTSPTNPTGPVPNAASLHASQACVSGHRAKATVSGSNIASVRFYVSGKHITTVTQPNAKGGYSVSMSCARLSVGAHSARAVVTFAQGSSQTLRFQITHSAQASPRFTG